MEWVTDDGTTVIEDAAGNLTYVPQSGAAYKPDTSILGDFLRSVTQGAASAINAKLRADGQPAPGAARITSASIAASPLIPLAIAGGLGFLAYKLLK